VQLDLELMVYIESSARTTPSSGQRETANDCAHAISVLARRIEGDMGGELKAGLIVTCGRTDEVVMHISPQSG